MTDINDKFPIFQRVSYILSMFITDAGKTILTVVAVDPDRWDTVTYSLDQSSVDASHLDARPADPAKVFSINEKSGALSVVQYPSQATTGYLTFIVSATDGWFYFLSKLLGKPFF